MAKTQIKSTMGQTGCYLLFDYEEGKKLESYIDWVVWDGRTARIAVDKLCSLIDALRKFGYTLSVG